MRRSSNDVFDSPIVFIVINPVAVRSEKWVPGHETSSSLQASLTPQFRPKSFCTEMGLLKDTASSVLGNTADVLDDTANAIEGDKASQPSTTAPAADDAATKGDAETSPADGETAASGASSGMLPLLCPIRCSSGESFAMAWTNYLQRYLRVSA